MNRPNALPTITIEGVNFFVDFRLEEIRPCNYPFISMYFDDLEEQFKAEIRKIRAIETNYGHIKSLDN